MSFPQVFVDAKTEVTLLTQKHFPLAFAFTDLRFNFRALMN